MNHTQIRTITPQCHSCKDKPAVKKKLSGYFVLGQMHTPYFDIVVTKITVKK